MKDGGREGIRTPGLLVANEALSQLSYSPTSSKSILANANCLANISRETNSSRLPRSKLFNRNLSSLGMILWLIDRAAHALGHNASRVLVQRPRLRNRLDGLLHLRVGFEQDLEAFLLAKY